MPVTLGPYFVEDDLVKNKSAIVTMAEKYLGVEVNDVTWKPTPGPLGTDGEHSIVVHVSEHNSAIDPDHVYALTKALEQRWGHIMVWVSSLCPLCNERPFQHLGYSDPEPDEDWVTGCDSCELKHYQQKQATVTHTCLNCGKDFSIKDSDDTYSLHLSLNVYSFKTKKSVASFNSDTNGAGNPGFCSSDCVKEKLATLLTTLGETHVGLF